MSGYDQRAPQLSITDPKVCRSYLVGNCPHDLFTNTKNELGPCAKVHNETLKTEYQAASAEQKRKWGFDFDYMRDMQHHIDSCNRKIEAAQRRLEKTPEEIRQTNALVRLSQNLLGLKLTPRSSSPSTNCRDISTPACSKSRSWASRAWSTWLSRSLPKSASRRPRRKRRSESFGLCQTLEALLATRSSKFAMFAAHTSAASTMIVASQTISTERCTWAMPRCASRTRPCRRSSRVATHLQTPIPHRAATWTAPEAAAAGVEAATEAVDTAEDEAEVVAEVAAEDDVGNSVSIRRSRCVHDDTHGSAYYSISATL